MPADTTRPSVHDEVGLDRVLFFTDAVVAIAITLLALPLVDAAITARSTLVFLGHDSFYLVAATISFVSIAGSWRAQHRLFRDVVGYSETVVTIQFIWVASIVALPIATALIVVAPSTDRLSLVIYLVVITVTAALARVQHEVLVRGGFLHRPRESAVSRVNDWLPIGLRLVAILLSALFPQLGLWTLLALVPGTLFAIVTRPARIREAEAAA